jgi:PAS domain S-box-containing protein
MVGAATHLYEQLFEKGEIPRCSTSEDDIIIIANSKFRSIFGLNTNDVITGAVKLQELIFSRFSDSDLIELNEELNQFRQRKGSADGKLSILNAHGQKIKLDFHRKLIRAESVHMIAYEFIDVTEKIEYRKTLRSTNERLTIAADVSNLGVWEYGFENKKWHLNDTILNLFGIEKFNGSAEGFNDVIDKNDLSFLYEAWNNAKKTSEPLNINIRINHIKKGKRNLQISGKTLHKSDGTLWRFVGTVSDITKQRLREDEVIRDRERLKSLVDSQSSFIIRINDKGVITFCNQSFRDAFNKELSCTGEHSLSEFLNTRDFNAVIQTVTLCKENPGKIYTVLSGDQNDKSYLDIDWEFTAIVINNGKQIEIQGLGRDISDRVALLSKVEESYSNLNALINNFNNISIWSIDKKYRLTACNNHFVEKFNLYFNTKLKLGDDLTVLSSLDNNKDWKAAYDKAMNSGAYEMQYDINNRQYRVSCSPIYTSGEVSGVAIYSIDITESNIAQHELRLSKERLQFAIEGNQYMIWDLNLPSGEIVFSDAFYSSLGYLSNDTTRDIAFWDKVVHPDDLKEIRDTYASLLNGTQTEFLSEFRILNAAGEYRWMQNRGHVFEFNIDTEHRRIIGIIRDISDKKTIDNQLKTYLEKLEKFAYLTSHNLRRPVANIIGLSSLMQEELNVGVTMKDYLIEIKRSSSQLDQVIKEMTEAISFGNGNPSIKKTSSLQTVWFIDDDEINNMLSERMMKRVMPEAIVKSFLHAEDALEILKNNTADYPDAIFLDINMPCMNGWEFLDSLTVLNINIDVYMLTSSIDSRDQDKASKYTQVNDFISKPLREERLRLIIN